jgi:N-acyl-D-aspartate/D-glutamate deacylase
VLDAAGRYVSPGFIDIHTHSDLTILVNRRAESAVRQGATTHVIGNCGMAPAPVDEGHMDEIQRYWGPVSIQPEVSWEWRNYNEYLQALESGGLGINIAPLAGHGALRMAVMGLEEREPTSAELEQMKKLLENAMQAGAFGMSTGLVYPPGCFASTGEVIELCRVVSRYRGCTLRTSAGARNDPEAVAEAIHIGGRRACGSNLAQRPSTAHTCDARANLRLVEEAQGRGRT